MGDIGDKTPANSYKSLIRVDDGASEGHEEFHASSTVKRLTTAGGATGSAVFVSGEHLIVSRQDVTSLAGTGTPSSGTFDTHFQNSNELTVRANTGASILAVEAGSDSYTSGAGTGNLGARIRLVTRAYQDGEANNDNKGFGQQMWEIMNYGDNWSSDPVENAGRFIIKDTTENQDRFVIKAALGNDGFRTGSAYIISETGMHGVATTTNDYQFRVGGQGDAKIDRMLFVTEVTYYVAAGSYDYGSGACVPSDENDGYDYKKPLKTMDEALSRIASTRGGNTRVNIHLIMQTIDSDGSLSTRTAQGNWNTIGGKMADNNSRVPDGDGVEGDNYISSPYFTIFDKRIRFRGYTYNAQTKQIHATLAHKDETSSSNNGRSIVSAPNVYWACYQQSNSMWAPIYLALYNAQIEFMRINVITPDPTDQTLTDSGSADTDKSVARYGYGMQSKGDLSYAGVKISNTSTITPTTTTRRDWMRVGTLKDAIDNSATTINVLRLTTEGNYSPKLPMGSGGNFIMLKKSDGTCEILKKTSIGTPDTTGGASNRFYPIGVTRGYRQHSTHKVAWDAGTEVYTSYYWQNQRGCISVSANYGRNSGVYFSYAPLTLQDFPLLYVGEYSPGVEINHYRSPINLSDRAKDYVKGNVYNNTPAGDWGSTSFQADGALDNARTTTLLKTTNSTNSLYKGYFIMHLPFTTHPWFSNATCDTTSGAATITHDADSKIVVGLSVRGPGLPYDAYIKSIDSATQFTVGKLSTVTGENFAGGTSANCTASASDVTLKFSPSRLHLDGTVTNSGEIMCVVDRLGGSRAHVMRGVLGTATDAIADDSYFTRIYPSTAQWASQCLSQNTQSWGNIAWDPVNPKWGNWTGCTSYTGAYARIYSNVKINMVAWGNNISGDNGLRTNTFSNETGVLENLTNDYTEQSSWHQTGVFPFFADVANGWTYATNGIPTPSRLDFCQDMLHPSTQGDGWKYKGWNVAKEDSSWQQGTRGRGHSPFLVNHHTTHQHTSMQYGVSFNTRMSVQGVDVDGYNPAGGTQSDGSTRHYGPNHSTILDVQGLGALRVPLLTTAQRDLLDQSDGMIIYNTTTDKLQVAVNSTWTDLH